MSAPPIACTLEDAERRERMRKLHGRVLPGVEEAVELEDGYALRFPGDPEWARELAELVIFERACCRFLSFGLRAQPDQGPVWLTLRGPEGTKEFLRRSWFRDAEGAAIVRVGGSEEAGRTSRNRCGGLIGSPSTRR